MEGFAHIFEGVADPRRSNATLGDLDGMPMIGLPSVPCGGGAAPTWSALAVPRGKGDFMRLAHGIPGRDTFPNPFNTPDPGGLQRPKLRNAEGWAAGLGGGVVAVDGKALRLSFAAATSRSPPHPVRAFADGAHPVLGQVRMKDKSNGIAAVTALLGMKANNCRGQGVPAAGLTVPIPAAAAAAS